MILRPELRSHDREALPGHWFSVNQCHKSGDSCLTASESWKPKFGNFIGSPAGRSYSDASILSKCMAKSPKGRRWTRKFKLL